MAGLIHEHFKDEILTEISWMLTVINDLSSRLGMETYETLLIKHPVQPEEERAISTFFVFRVQKPDSFSIQEVQEIIAEDFLATTQKQWSYLMSWSKKVDSSHVLTVRPIEKIILRSSNELS